MTDESERAWGARMSQWLAVLEAEPERDSEIARELFDLVSSGDFPDTEARGPMYAFWDAIDLAKQGTWGVLEEEREKLRTFLVHYAAKASP